MIFPVVTKDALWRSSEKCKRHTKKYNDFRTADLKEAKFYRSWEKCFYGAWKGDEIWAVSLRILSGNLRSLINKPGRVNEAICTKRDAKIILAAIEDKYLITGSTGEHGRLNIKPIFKAA